MISAEKLWSTWKIAEAYHSRPSQILGITGVEAFFLDRAVASFGMAVEADLEAARNKKGSDAAKRMAVIMALHKWTGQGSFR